MREAQDPNDLAFEAGDIIEVISETNADWWTGRNRSGKQGLFPSNYVERLPPRSLSPIFVPEPRKSIMSRGSSEQRYSSPALPNPSPHPSPQPYPAPPQTHYPPPGGYYPPAGPPPGAMNYSYAPPPGPPTPQPVAQQAPVKKNKFGGLGQVVSVVTCSLTARMTTVCRWRNLQPVERALELVSAIWGYCKQD